MDPVRSSDGCRTKTYIALVSLGLLLTSAGCAMRSGAPAHGVRDAVDAPAAVPPVAAAANDPAIDESARTTAHDGLRQEAAREVEAPAAPAPVETDLPPEELTQAPHDDLGEVTPELDPAELERERRRLSSEPPAIDLPVETNDQVLAWLDYYAHRHPDSFRPGLERSGRWVERFRSIFAEAGLPQDLVYMAHVESAYKPSAYSRAGAKGMFQFIAATARRYGLRVDYWVDERADPEKSARAAAAYLADLHGQFDDWYLALAAYNAGEGKIRRALARSGKHDFWGIARTRHIRRETKNYVPAILAAVLISKDPAKHGFDFVPDPPIVYDSIEVEGAADLRVLARCAGSDVATMRALNPALRRQQTPPDATTTVRVPPGSGERTLAALEQVPRSERVLYARHPVKSGDSLWSIARNYGVSVAAIQTTNGMGRSTLIRPGQVLVIPTAASSDYAAPYTVETSDAPDGVALTYRVRRGDTLYRLSRIYRTTPASIAAASGIPVDATLQIGQRLTVIPGARSAERASVVARNGSVAGASARGDASKRAALTHTVRRGDTLWRIAARYRTTVEQICALNRITPSTTLRPGIKLAVAQ